MTVETYPITKPVIYSYEAKVDGQSCSGFAFSYSLSERINECLARKHTGDIKVLEYHIIGRHVEYAGAFEFAIERIETAKCINELPFTVASYDDLIHYKTIPELLKKSSFKVSPQSKEWYLLESLLDLWLREYHGREGVNGHLKQVAV